MLRFIKLTGRDFVLGLRGWELWTRLAWNEIRRKYRRSVIGPLWSSINFGIFAIALGLLYANLLQQDLAIYLPHLILGMLVWNLLTNVMVEGCRIFGTMRIYIHEINTPLTTFIFVLVWRNIIVFVFNFLVFGVAAVLLPVVPSVSWLLAAVGLMFILLNALWAGTLLAVVAARYHDIGEIVGSTMRVVFFLTPIIWLPGTGRFEVLLNVNPFFHLIEIFRAHMLGSFASSTSWIVVTMVTVIGWTVTAVIYGKYRDRISFWI